MIDPSSFKIQGLTLGLSALIGEKADQFATVVLANKDGHQWKTRIPYEHYQFTQPNQLQFISLGKNDSSLLLDNIVLTNTKR